VDQKLEYPKINL